MLRGLSKNAKFRKKPPITGKIGRLFWNTIDINDTGIVMDNRDVCVCVKPIVVAS